ncbi:MAG: bifunctional folylpolyglutamate synthase/dihydrofolate synthase [bacterium]
MTQHSDNYHASLDYLYGRLNYEHLGLPRGSEGLGLGRMRRLMRRLGDPQESYKIIHVAGTKGKGSTCTMLAAAATGCGYKTGLFCSPHLHFLEERYRVDGRMIDRHMLARLVEEIRPAVEAIDACHTEALKLTFFEITTAIGLLYFSRQKCDLVVLEVGMGGRLDSTNIVRPEVAVITSISLDHTRQLGNTTASIAREKAGIFKRGGVAISGVTDPPAAEVIQHIAHQRKCQFYRVGPDYEFQPCAVPNVIHKPEPIAFQLKTWARDWGVMPSPLLGPHQVENAALCLATLDAAETFGLHFDREKICQAWQGLQMPARVEILGTSPLLVIDGAHNAASAQALAETIKISFPPLKGPRVLVFGTTREKDLEGQIAHLLPLFAKIVITQYQKNPRARSLEETRAAIESAGRSVDAEILQPVEACHEAQAMAGPDGLVVVTGSLFLAAEIRAAILGIEDQTLEEIRK